MTEAERAVIIDALLAIHSALGEAAPGNLGDLADLHKAIHALRGLAEKQQQTDDWHYQHGWDERG